MLLNASIPILRINGENYKKLNQIERIWSYEKSIKGI